MTPDEDEIRVPRPLLEPFVRIAAAMERYEAMAGRKLPDSRPLAAPLDDIPKDGEYVSLGMVRELAGLVRESRGD